MSYYTVLKENEDQGMVNFRTDSEVPTQITNRMPKPRRFLNTELSKYKKTQVQSILEGSRNEAVSLVITTEEASSGMKGRKL
jgi:hypothetical protein